MNEEKEGDNYPSPEIYVVKNEERNGESVVQKRRWQCRSCEKSFTQNAGLYNHMKRKHGMTVYAKASIVCKEPNCDFKCSMRDKLQSHLVTVHNKPLAFSTLKFSSMSDFEEWKEVFEKKEKCRFVKKSGTRIRSSTGEKHTYLYCSRSGTFISNSKGKRTQIKKGTCKISNYCTASIDCIEDQNGTVIAKLCSTHYGHEPSVEYLRLTKSDKSVIADKLAQGVPRDVVIDNVRASVGENIDRIHFLTMKDIRNIERSYGIKNDSKQKSSVQGFASVNEWVKEMETFGDESPVIFYKPKNSPEILNDDCKCLEIQDFCLVLMTKGQQDIFKKFGQNGVFYLTWLNISNGYDLSLLTLMVADDLNEAFPVAYMICSRITHEIEVLFFKIIQDKLGSFCARAIMTDDRKSLYDSWCSVMGFVPYHLLSNRFVDADWRDRLISVHNEDVQCAVYEVLYSYLSCTDSTKFEENLNAFIKHLKENEDTLIFGLYFEDTYLHRVRLWAGCYDKKSVGINEHLNLDIVYNELVAVCNNKGKFSKLLDKTLQGLLTIVRDRQHNRNSKITKQVNELAHHHKISMNINLDGINAIENRKWQIKSESANFVFTVTRKTYECSENCPLICCECKMCSHIFECTCKVYNFDRTMCKHIHAIGRLFQKSMRALEGISEVASYSYGNEVAEEMTVSNTESELMDDNCPEKNKVSKKEENKVEGKEEKKENILKKEGDNMPDVDSVVKNVVFRQKGNIMVMKINNMLEYIQLGVSDINNPVLLKKLFLKLKKVKNFMESGFYKDNMKKRGRGRPKKVQVEETVQPAKKKVGRPRKNSTDEFIIRPRKLQEILQDDFLQEQLSQQIEIDGDKSKEESVSSNDNKDNVGKKEVEEEQTPPVIPKKRGRKPKIKLENKSDEVVSENKKIKVESPEANHESSDRRRSRRVIKVKRFHFDEPYVKRKEDTRSETKTNEVTDVPSDSVTSESHEKSSNEDVNKSDIEDSTETSDEINNIKNDVSDANLSTDCKVVDEELDENDITIEKIVEVASSENETESSLNTTENITS